MTFASIINSGLTREQLQSHLRSSHSLSPLQVMGIEMILKDVMAAKAYRIVKMLYRIDPKWTLDEAAAFFEGHPVHLYLAAKHIMIAPMPHEYDPNAVDDYEEEFCTGALPWAPVVADIERRAADSAQKGRPWGQQELMVNFLYPAGVIMRTALSNDGIAAHFDALMREIHNPTMREAATWLRETLFGPHHARYFGGERPRAGPKEAVLAIAGLNIARRLDHLMITLAGV